MCIDKMQNGFVPEPPFATTTVAYLSIKTWLLDHIHNRLVLSSVTNSIRVEGQIRQTIFFIETGVINHKQGGVPACLESSEGFCVNTKQGMFGEHTTIYRKNHKTTISFDTTKASWQTAILSGGR